MPKISSYFSTKESAGGEPCRLFTFARGGRTWRLTSANTAVTVTLTGLTYDATLIERDRLERNPEIRAATIALRAARTSAIANALREVHTHPMTLQIERYQPGDAGSRPIVEAWGEVGNVNLNGGFVEFDLIQGAYRFDQLFPSLLIERQCQWPAYSAESGIDERDFSYTTTITDITGLVVTVASIGLAYNGYYNSGQIRFGEDAAAERIFIDYNVGAQLVVVGALPTSLVAAYAAFIAGGPPVAVTLLAGDDRTLKTRRDRFGPEAVDRFLGFDLLPSSDPLQYGVNTAPVNLTPYGPADGSTITPGPAPTAGLPVRLFPMLDESDTTGAITLTLSDPNARFVSLEYRTNATGFDPDWSAWADMPVVVVGTPTSYGATAAKGVGGFVAIEARLTYLDDAMVAQTIHASWNFTRPYYTIGVVGPNISDPSETIVSQGSVPGATFVRAFVSLTADAHVRALIDHSNQQMRIHVDARGGPFTIHLPTVDLDGTAFTNYLSGGAVITSFVVNGLAVLNAELLAFGVGIDWDVIA